MPSPENVLKTTDPQPPADNYGDMSNDELRALAQERGIELGHGYVKNDDIATMLRAQDGATGGGQKNARAEGHGVNVGHQVAAPGTDLHATADFIPPDQPEHRQDANLKPALGAKKQEGVIYVEREQLRAMAKGEVVEVGGVKLAAGPDFPESHKVA